MSRMGEMIQLLALLHGRTDAGQTMESSIHAPSLDDEGTSDVLENDMEATEGNPEPQDGTPEEHPVVVLPDGRRFALDEYAITRPDGRTVTVRDGLRFQDDYTRKTQELAQQKRDLDEQLRNAQYWSMQYQQLANQPPTQQPQTTAQQQEQQEQQEFVLTDEDFASDTERVLYQQLQQVQGQLQQYERRVQQYDERFSTYDQQQQDAALDQALRSAVIQNGLADATDYTAVQTQVDELIAEAQGRISDVRNHIADIAELRALRAENQALKTQSAGTTRQQLGTQASTVAPTQAPPSNMRPGQRRVDWKSSDAQRVNSILTNYPNLVSE